MITKLTLLRTAVRADVRIGENEYGGAVTATVEVSRKADEVVAALAPLETLLLNTAKQHVVASADRAEFNEAVRTGVATGIAKERERIKRDGAAEAERRIRDLERERDRAVRAIDAVRAERDRAIATARFHQQTT